ncbi:transcriptional regulator ROK family protein [Rhizobium rhizosphaerae]|uniref:Transcriptional regulator ROK family protein n=1 Tax=Xaviernesmea rhizosphaerae TaxID=1672749 RepID=A0ABX3PDL2_9HYPH|nr:ROK family transcriptional regulator [Xaviernesmea rhizosphaerae]OQP86576.1 transcriptional regulator ROK family protein [Xaviernesmea rhizosphaerae]
MARVNQADSGSGPGTGDEGEERIAGSRIEHARIHNRRLVFETIFQRGPISRVEIASVIRLKPQTISSITRELLEQGLIVEAGRSSGLRGQPQIYLEANAEAGFSIGIHLDQNLCSILVLDLTRKERARRVTRIDTGDPANAVKALSSTLSALLAEQAVSSEHIWGVGLVLPTFGSAGDDFDFSMRHWQAWRDFPFADELHRLTGYAILVENDATAAAIGERIHRPDTQEATFVYYYIGHGSGAGLIIDGYPYKGIGGTAGEIGLLPFAGLGGSQTWPESGPEAADGTAAQGGLISIGGLGLACGLGLNPDPARILQLLAIRDHRLMDWLASAARLLRDVVAIIEVMYDPGFIAVGGALPQPLIERLVDRAYPLRPTPAARRDRVHPRLITARLSEDAAVTGAAMLPIFVNTSHNFRHLYIRQNLADVRPFEVAGSAQP